MRDKHYKTILLKHAFSWTDHGTVVKMHKNTECSLFLLRETAWPPLAPLISDFLRIGEHTLNVSAPLQRHRPPRSKRQMPEAPVLHMLFGLTLGGCVLTVRPQAWAAACRYGTGNGPGGWNSWRLIWRKPNIQRFLEIWHVMSMSSHTSVQEVLVYFINMAFTVIFQSAWFFEEDPWGAVEILDLLSGFRRNVSVRVNVPFPSVFF